MDSGNTLERIADYGWRLDGKGTPIEIPDVGREDLTHLFAHLGFNLGVEVGTERGIYAETLCKANPKLSLYCVDPYLAYDGYREHVSQRKLDDFWGEATLRLMPYTCWIQRWFSIEAVNWHKDNSLDFVYLDGNHNLLHVIQDLHAWLPKVKSGGIIAGHDYIRRKKGRYTAEVHVVEAVNAFTEAYHIRPWFTVGTKEQREGEIRDSARSWFWVKE